MAAQFEMSLCKWTGAYYIRIQAMAVKHHNSLYQEFDEHSIPDSKYNVITKYLTVDDEWLYL